MTETLAAPDRAGVPRPEPRRRVAWTIPPPALLLGGIAVTIAVHLVLSAAMRVPIIQPDELGYLQNARFLARGGLRSETEYYPGFSLLLVPLWWMSSSPQFVFRGALISEAVISGIGVLLLWRLSRAVVPDLRGWRRALVVAVASAYPAELLYGNFALAEITFAVVFSGVVLIAAQALPGRQPRWWAALGASSGLLALVHPRGFAVVVAVALLGLVVLGVRAASIRPLAALGAGIAAGLALTRWLVTYTKGTARTGFGAYRPDTVLSKSLSVHGGLSLLSELAGQLWYLSLATLGLVPFGLVLGIRALHRVATGDRRPWVLAQSFATLSFLGVWALSSLFMNLGERADKLIYGRYNDGVIAPLLVIALSEILAPRLSRKARRLHHVRQAPVGGRWAVAAALCVIVTGASVQLGHTTAALHGVLNPANVLGLASLLNRMSDHIHVVTMSAIVLGVIGALALVSWRLPVVAALAVAGLFVWSVVDLQNGYFVPGTNARAGQDDIVTALRAAARIPGVSVACIGWDPGDSHELDFNYYNDRFLVPSQLFAFFDAGAGTLPCGTLVVSARPDLGKIYPGARLVTSENFVSQSLWAVPIAGDPSFPALAAAGWLSPPGGSGTAAAPLPPEARKGSVLSVLPAGQVDVRASTPTTVAVTVSHLTGGAPWPNIDALHAPSGVYAVRLAVRWYTPDGKAGADNSAACGASPGSPVPVACPNADLPETLLPGQRTRIDVRLAAVDTTGHPLDPGYYLVHLGLFQEGVASFSDDGVIIPVHVVP